MKGRLPASPKFTLDKSEAELFTWVCKHTWYIQGVVNPVIIVDPADHTIGVMGYYTNLKSRLSETGLVVLKDSESMVMFGPRGVAAFGDDVFYLEFLEEDHYKCSVPIGDVTFTAAGLQLFDIVNAEPWPQHVEVVLKYWMKQRPNLRISSRWPRKKANREGDKPEA